MTDTFRNLDRIESGYTVFERDQVLTPGQLNGVASYLDDQGRLTRLALLGAGIACGLRPTIADNRVNLSHGVGITTDGDVLYMDQDTAYNRYKVYDASAPKYAPFYRGDEMIRAYELVREGDEDSRARALSGFREREGVAPRALAAVLYVESALHDGDLCTGTDCDNRGKDSLHVTKLLLVEPQSAAALLGALATPDAAARTPLDPVVVARPVLQGALASEADIAAIYRKACEAIHRALLRALGAFYAPCKWFLHDIVPSDPAPEWGRSLAAIRDAAPSRGIQYYYDFLKDVAETYNAFLETLFGDTAVCCPNVGAFPKHLVLGSIDPEQHAAVGRTAFYPSPVVSERFEQRGHARFLLRKLDALISTFAVPGGGEIRVTPSAFEDRSLEERAIPFYYVMRQEVPVHLAWSYQRSRRGMERYNYSYNADRYAGAGAALRPLEAQIGAFDFFRIEGHIGRPLIQARDELQGLIRKNSLPFDVVALSLGGQPPVRPPFPWRHPHLYELRDLVRADLAMQLEDAGRFGDAFVGEVKAAVAGNLVTDADNEGTPILRTAEKATTAIASHAKKAFAKIASEAYNPLSDWQDDVARITESAAEMNQDLSPVTKKDFITPLDSLIGGQPARWLSWLDEFIKDAEVQEAKRSELPDFLAEHPGIEHYAGVLRGGTFVLVHDAAGIVVADFMLPYQFPEQRRAEPPKPPKPPKPPLRPDIVFKKPIRIVPFPDRLRMEKIRTDLFTEVKKDIAVQTNYLGAIKDTIGIFAGLKAGDVLQPTGPFVRPGALAADPLVNLSLADMKLKTQLTETLRGERAKPGLDEPTRKKLDTQIANAENELAAAIARSTEVVADRGIDVRPGTDGATVMANAAASLATVKGDAARALVKNRLDKLTNVGSPDFRAAIGNLIRNR
jgi:hypothetical protein